jgi:hypothetical protein
MAIDQQPIVVPANATRHRMWMCAALSIWAVGVIGGAGFALLYEFTPTPSAVVDSYWPVAASTKLATNRPTLIMFVHPLCPCSRASLNELATLMALCAGEVETQVLFFQLPTATADVTHTELWQSAKHIPGVVPRVDMGGTEQQLFGARSSGEVFLYNPAGDLLFHGGITGSRGHEGDNVGRSQVEAILLRQRPTLAKTPVFGCELQGTCDISNSANKGHAP